MKAGLNSKVSKWTTFPEVDLKGQKVRVNFVFDQLFERHQELDRFFHRIFYLRARLKKKKKRTNVSVS